jgi:hypothetical protein
MQVIKLFAFLIAFQFFNANADNIEITPAIENNKLIISLKNIADNVFNITEIELPNKPSKQTDSNLNKFQISRQLNPRETIHIPILDAHEIRQFTNVDPVQYPFICLKLDYNYCKGKGDFNPIELAPFAVSVNYKLGTFVKLKTMQGFYIYYKTTPD